MKPKTKMKLVTVLDHPTIKMTDTQWGPMSYEAWCGKEVERMNTKGARVSVVREDGFVAIGRE